MQFVWLTRPLCHTASPRHLVDWIRYSERMRGFFKFKAITNPSRNRLEQYSVSSSPLLFPNSIHHSKMPPVPGRRKGLTPIQKWELCLLRAQNPTMKLGEFAELPACPRRPDGRPLPISSISDHLKGWEERVKHGPPEGA